MLLSREAHAGAQGEAYLPIGMKGHMLHLGLAFADPWAAVTVNAPLPAPYPPSGNWPLDCSGLHQGWEVKPAGPEAWGWRLPALLLLPLCSKAGRMA